MSEITKEELLAFTEANTKSAIALDKVADRLADVLSNQEKIIQGITVDIPKNITTEVVKQYDQIHGDTVSYLKRIEQSTKELNDTLTTKLPGTLMEKFNSSEMAKDIDHFKLIAGAIGFIVIVAIVILKFVFGAPTITQDQIRQVITQYQAETQQTAPAEVTK